MKHEIHLPPATRLPWLAHPSRRPPVAQRLHTLRRAVRRRLPDTESLAFALAAAVGLGTSLALLVMLALAHL